MQNIMNHKINPADTEGSGMGRGVPELLVLSQANNRNINAASSTYLEATNYATWDGPGVNEISITPLITTTQGAVQNGQACLVVYNAPNAAVAAAWFADIGSANSPIAYDLVIAGQTLIKQFYNKTGPSPIRRVDVLPIGTGNTVMRVVIGAN